MQNARDILLATSRRLNEGIRALEATVESGGPASAEIDAVRREAGEALDRLRAVQGATGVVGDTIPKVIQHLDLFMEIAASAESAPSLSRKLLRHLLDEQLELTAAAERDASSAGTAPAGDSLAAPGRPTPGLPGGRRALTVGSLIGR